MSSSSLPPIKGLSALNSLSHRCPETNSSIITDNDYDGGNGDDIVTFTSDNLLCAFVELFIKTPPSSLASTAAFYNIGERTLKRYQSQIASTLGLSQNSSRLIRDHFLRQYTVDSATIFLRNYCCEVRAPSQNSRYNGGYSRKRVKNGEHHSVNPASSSESTNIMDENFEEEEVTAAMNNLAFEESNANFFSFKPRTSLSTVFEEKFLFEYNVKVYFNGQPLLCLIFKASEFLEISRVKHLSAAEVVVEISSQTAARKNKVKKCTVGEGPPSQAMYAAKLVVDLERTKVELDNARAARKAVKAAQTLMSKLAIGTNLLLLLF